MNSYHECADARTGNVLTTLKSINQGYLANVPLTQNTDFASIETPNRSKNLPERFWKGFWSFWIFHNYEENIVFQLKFWNYFEIHNVKMRNFGWSIHNTVHTLPKVLWLGCVFRKSGLPTSNSNDSVFGQS